MLTVVFERRICIANGKSFMELVIFLERTLYASYGADSSVVGDPRAWAVVVSH